MTDETKPSLLLITDLEASPDFASVIKALVASGLTTVWTPRPLLIPKNDPLHSILADMNQYEGPEGLDALSTANIRQTIVWASSGLTREASLCQNLHKLASFPDSKVSLLGIPVDLGVLLGTIGQGETPTACLDRFQLDVGPSGGSGCPSLSMVRSIIEVDIQPVRTIRLNLNTIPGAPTHQFTLSDATNAAILMLRNILSPRTLVSASGPPITPETMILTQNLVWASPERPIGEVPVRVALQISPPPKDAKQAGRWVDLTATGWKGEVSAQFNGQDSYGCGGYWTIQRKMNAQFEFPRILKGCRTGTRVPSLLSGAELDTLPSILDVYEVNQWASCLMRSDGKKAVFR